MRDCLIFLCSATLVEVASCTWMCTLCHSPVLCFAGCVRFGSDCTETLLSAYWVQDPGIASEFRLVDIHQEALSTIHPLFAFCSSSCSGEMLSCTVDFYALTF